MIESPRMLVLTWMMKIVQISEIAPIVSVETPGVRWRGWIRPKAFGIAPNLAIESVVRAVGRIVVCVDADADVSTAMMSSLSKGEPKTLSPRALRMSLWWWVRNWVPAYDWAAVATSR